MLCDLVSMNGGIAQFHLIKRSLVNKLNDVSFQMMQGNTDSEHCFALFLTILDKMSPLEEPCSPTVMRHALVQTIREINNLCREFQIKEASLLNLPFRMEIP